MSLDATSWVLRQHIPDPAAKLLLVVLSDMTGDEYGNIRWDPGITQTLSDSTSMPVDDVRRAMLSLQDRGFLSLPYVGTSIESNAEQWYIRINLGEPVQA